MQKNNLSKIEVTFKIKITLIIFGLFLFFVFLEVGLRLGGFVLLSLQEHRNLQSMKQKGSYRVLCLGESTTQGEYPRLLEKALNLRNMGVHFSVINKGKGGTNTSTILYQVGSYLDEYNPDMVITMMGINDKGDYVLYERFTTSKIMLLVRSFRTYKLIRILWFHILIKVKKIVPDEGRRRFGEVQSYSPKVGLNVTPAETILIEDPLKKAIELNPENDDFYVRLGELYRVQDKLSQAEDLFKKAIELNPKNDDAHAKLGWLYQSQGKFSQAEDLFKRAIDLNPENDSNIYVGLGWLYQSQGKFSQAEDLFKRAIDINPENDSIYGAMSVLYEGISKPELSKKYLQKANRLRLGRYNPLTIINYRKLKEILDKRGVKLVCVQYPMRNVELLKKIFQGQIEGVIFVDNEKVFKEAVKIASYKEYFTDMFGGDFGHCTDKGNQLLAQNIANIIFKEMFDK